MRDPFITPSGLDRINVIGTSGSGKSVFARRLAERLAAPLIEMDRLYWHSNWSPSTDNEFFDKLKNQLSGSRWILDGNYTRTVSMKWEQVETVIWLDYTFLRTITRAVKRAMLRSWSKQEIWPGSGNRETFRKSFLSRDSIILWSIKTHSKNQLKYQSAIVDERYSHIRFIRFIHPNQAEAWLQSLDESKLTKSLAP
ncbi:adenylate kinase [Luteolibacter pohnpeiensis]|uniref:Adenylate kinase n=1 Tax=Luteolibacter pohnpeiensis TaxID=454153 RepID=A0A934S310_9BACT|nr:AAA family ATPase [Luteolibacter pohnpeiensis]MBK1880963.1 adenylate kinase [Luteolibacter pohnpeiensis]